MAHHWTRDNQINIMKSLKIAVLIDAENISGKDFETHMRLLAPIGSICRQIAIANWKRNNPKSWKDLILSEKIEKVECDSLEKNGADKCIMRLIGSILRKNDDIDAILFYSKDGDYFGAMALLEGMGKSSIVFLVPNVSHKLISQATLQVCIKSGRITDQQGTIIRESQKLLPGTKVVGNLLSILPPTTNLLNKDICPIRNEIKNVLIKSGGKKLLSQIGEEIRAKFPSFNPSNYQCKKMTLFLKKHVRFVQLELDQDNSTYWVSLNK